MWDQCVALRLPKQEDTSELMVRNFRSVYFHQHSLLPLALVTHQGPCKRSQHCWLTRRNMLRAFAHHVVSCCVLLRLVGSCWMKFETSSRPTTITRDSIFLPVLFTIGSLRCFVNPVCILFFIWHTHTEVGHLAARVFFKTRMRLF